MGRLLLMILVLITACPVQAQEVAGVKLPTVAEVGGQQLPLRGADLLRWKWVVKIYVAALYLPPTAEPLADSPRRIAFHYRRGFTAEQLAEATSKTISRGLDPVAVTAFAAELAAFNQLYRPVQEGDVMTIDYLPGTGTTLGLNGTVLGTVPGAAFARALFAIWIGDHAVDDELKSALLAQP